MSRWQHFTLFLDRDGVINRKLENDYVKTPEEFEFLPGVLEALKGFKKFFRKIIIVTNQQGIGKGLMTVEELEKVHAFMLRTIKAAGGRIDAIYYCPSLASQNDPNRKPEIGMALQAKKDYPEINFSKALMLGDSASDMLFAKNAGMRKIWIGSSESDPHHLALKHYPDLLAFYHQIST